MEGEPHGYEDLPGDEATHPDDRVRRIYEGLEDAWRTGQRIDDLTAKRIARELDPGSGPLHSFAETGAIPDDMELHLAVAEEAVADLEMKSHIPWLGALRDYLDRRLLRSALPGWSELGTEKGEA